MTFGDKNIFAIEVELSDNFGGPFLFGKICYWISGKMVGDFDLGTSLREVLSDFTYIAKSNGQRSGKGLCHLTDQELFARVDNAIFGTIGTNSSVHDCELELKRFDICISIDVFNEWKVYLFDCTDETRLLYKNEAIGSLQSRSIPTGYFDNIALELFEYLDKLYDLALAQE